MNTNKTLRFTLAEIKVFHEMARETVPFRADMIFDGRRVGYISNDGNGGMPVYSIFKGYREEVESYFRGRLLDVGLACEEIVFGNCEGF